MVRFLDSAEVSEQPPDWLRPDTPEPGFFFATNREWLGVVVRLRQYPNRAELMAQTVLVSPERFRDMWQRMKLRRMRRINAAG
jgi:hypothetical protein